MAKTDKSGTTRDERLKQALKANLGRRKAQAKARTSGQEQTKGPDKDQRGSDG